MARHVDGMVAFLDRGAEVFDYGNSLRAEARLGGSTRAFDYPGFVPAYIRPLFCEGKGPFRWVALSGDPADIAATDRAIVDEFSDDPALVRWIKAAEERVAYQGLPARICWLGYGERARAGWRFNELVRSGQVTAPIVIGRDHLDSGSVASPSGCSKRIERIGQVARRAGVARPPRRERADRGCRRAHRFRGGGHAAVARCGRAERLDDSRARQRPQPRVSTPPAWRDRVGRRRLLGVAGRGVLGLPKGAGRAL